MDLGTYVSNIQQELAVAAEAGGDDARALAERLAAPLESALRLALLDALSDAADEITRDLAPGSVHLRLRGREPGFVVTQPPSEPAEPADQPEATPAGRLAAAAPDDDGAMARINLRLSENLKGQVEEAAERAGLSVNGWLVRAAAAALDGAGPGTRPASPARTARGSQRYTGWVR
jgi:hypothetical protein